MCVCVCARVYINTPPHKQDVTESKFLKWNLTSLNSEFSFLLTGHKG